MALFVVACGILLMLGGAVSLLLGFDIVMTERGAAMTLGGVVALSGGVIAVGIGLALVRLNQLLRVLESRAAKPLRASAPDRPVVPIAVDEVRPPTAAPGPVAPLSPVRAPSAGDALIPAAAVAGVAAIGAATVLGRPSSEEEASALPAATSLPSSGMAEHPAPPEDSFPFTAQSEQMRGDTPPPVEPWQVQDQRNEPEPSGARLDDASQETSGQEVARDVFATPEVSPSSVATPLDLEEELSRALAETSVPPDPPTAAAPVEDRSFEDGLSKLLGRPVRAPAVPAAPPALQQDLADMLAPAPENIVAGEGENAVSDAPPVVDMTSPEDFIEEKSEAILQKHAETMTDVEAEEVADHVQDGAPEPVEPLVSETPSVLPENRDDDLFEDPAPAFSEDGGGLAEQPVVEPLVPPPAPEVPPQAPVLGTYTIGGRTYRMFGDGSVEAVSEGGDVERFASMDELRKHLARA